MEVRRRVLKGYEDAEGNIPFDSWLRGLRDAKGRSIIRIRLNRIEDGNFGDCESVGSGVYELRIHFGPGYRVYFGQDGDDVILLGGGDKGTQASDIQEAKKRWEDYNA